MVNDEHLDRAAFRLHLETETVQCVQDVFCHRASITTLSCRNGKIIVAIQLRVIYYKDLQLADYSPGQRLLRAMRLRLQ